MKRSDRQAVTLIELLIASTLLLLLTTLVFGYLIPATKAANKARIKSHLQQSATVVLAKIKQASATTSPGGVSWSMTDMVGLGFNPVEELQASNGLLKWSDSYTLFWWNEAEQKLWFADWKGETAEESSVVRAKRLPPDRLRTVFTDEPPLRKVMAQGVTEFSIQQGGSDVALVQPITVNLELVQPDLTDSPVVSRSVTFRVVNQQ